MFFLLFEYEISIAIVLYQESILACTQIKEEESEYFWLGEPFSFLQYEYKLLFFVVPI